MKKKLLVLLTAICTLCCSLSVYADTTKTQADGNSQATTTVTISKASTWSVTVPSTVDLTNKVESSPLNINNYSVLLSYDLAPDKQLSIDIKGDTLGTTNVIDLLNSSDVSSGKTLTIKKSDTDDTNDATTFTGKATSGSVTRSIFKTNVDDVYDASNPLHGTVYCIITLDTI